MIFIADTFHPLKNSMRKTGSIRIYDGRGLQSYNLTPEI